MNKSAEPVLEGGCLCGAVRYSVSARPFDADYCHCSVCRKSSGAPSIVWMDFQHEQVRWLSEPPEEYASSEYVRRGFCSQCGCSLSFRHCQHPEYLSLSVASLDKPEQVQANYHIYVSEQLPWFKVDDALPRYAQERPNEA